MFATVTRTSQWAKAVSPANLLRPSRLAHTVAGNTRRMGKKGKGPVEQEYLQLLAHKSRSSTSPYVCDTHTHLLSTFAEYTTKYSSSLAYHNIHEFVRGLYCSDTPPPTANGDGMRDR